MGSKFTTIRRILDGRNTKTWAVVDNCMAAVPQHLNTHGSHMCKAKHENSLQKLPICGPCKWICPERCTRDKASKVEEEQLRNSFDVCNARGEHCKLEKANESEAELSVYTKLGRGMIEQGQLHGWKRHTKVTYRQRNRWACVGAELPKRTTSQHALDYAKAWAVIKKGQVDAYGIELDGKTVAAGWGDKEEELAEVAINNSGALQGSLGRGRLE